MPSPQPQAHERLRLTDVQERHVANAILDALRRPTRKSVMGVQKSFEVYGANSIPNGMPPHVHTRWHVGYAQPHPGLDLPHVGILISDTTLTEAITETQGRPWNDLYRIVKQSTAQSLFMTRENGDGVWTWHRTPHTGFAGDAALTILRLALEAKHVQIAKEASYDAR